MSGRCEHAFPALGCEICNRFPGVAAWVQSPEFAAICERIQLGEASYAELVNATWEAARAQPEVKIARLEQTLRVTAKEAQLRLAQCKKENDQ